MCNCIERIENLLTERMLVDNPGATVVEPVELQNKTYQLPQFKLRLFIPTKGKFADTKGRNKKFEVSMNFTYCPYCGEKYSE